jgi:hypothetical protein
MDREYLSHGVKRSERARLNQGRKELALSLQTPMALYGEVPTESEGWTDKHTEDAEFYIAAIRCVRLDDGTTKKFYQMLMTKAALKQRQKLLKQKQRELSRALRKYEKTIAKRVKQDARLWVALLKG